ncbi:prepilin-type N-terminal cleavage/methylation domain-containing protein [Marinomonas sp. 2405UD68-3]|uniref:prepilin-type N-terminal cleavage/methylation domain-containing protein n=1 Tax=Marinomonas sp. 2405UD68-3 TaxID=3391835 RepID=UPI0039C9D18A
MQMPTSRFKSQKMAFTLLELLVVLAVLGGMLSIVSFTYQTDNEGKKLTQESQNVRLFLQNTLDKAWLDGVTYGATITSNEIALLELQAGEWVELSKTYQPADALFEWKLIERKEFNDLSETAKALVEKVDLVFSASGEYTPFELHIMYMQSGSENQRNTPLRILKGDGANVFVFDNE